MKGVLENLENPQRVFKFESNNYLGICVNFNEKNDELYTLVKEKRIGLFSSAPLLVDYGVPFPMNAPVEDYQYIYQNAKEYAILSNRRVQECRKALLALLHVCNISPFRPVGEILLSAARQVWAMRGGEGCGPRAHEW